MRAGAAGTRDPLGEIRNRLDQLGCADFRTSYREADWLGPTDRRSLTVASPDSEITLLTSGVPLLDRRCRREASGRPGATADQRRRVGVITNREIANLANESRLDHHVVEKDYVLGWLKGGQGQDDAR